MIELREVGKRYGATVAADGLNLSIAAGECVALLGPSGCGKSTALKLINRLVERDSGHIQFDGRYIDRYAPEQLRRRMGYAIQSIGLFPHWTVARNIATVPTLLGWSRERIDARVDDLLALLGLESHPMRERFPHQLSGGQQQRVGVARALAAQPSVLLMDEPFGALDPITRKDLQQELARIQRSKGQTLVLVTHDVDEALQLATRVVVMQHGQVVQEATPRELMNSPANPWVAQLVGGADAGLRRLALYTVAEGMRPVNGDGQTAGTPPELALRPTQTQRQALAQLLACGKDRLPVVDEQGCVMGELGLADLAQQAPLSNAANPQS